MSNGSPGHQSNKAFSIGNDHSDDEHHFYVDEKKEPLVFKRSDPLNTLVRATSEEKPLILPLPEKKRQLTPPPSEDDRHLVVTVFTLNEDEESTWKQASRFARYEEDSEGFDNHLGRPHVPAMPMSTYKSLQKIAAKAVLVPNVEYNNLVDFCETLEERIVDPDVPILGKSIVNLIEQQIERLEKQNGINRMHNSSTQSLRSNPGDSSNISPIQRSLLSAPNNLASMAYTPSKKLPHSVSGLRIRGSFLSQPSQSIHPLEPVIWDEANEVGMLMTGTVPELEVCRLVAVRFTETVTINQLFPNINNIRHLFFLVGPKLGDSEYLDMGRAFASVISNPAYTQSIEHLKSVDSVTRTIDRFLADTVVIAPGRIDNKNLIAADRIRKLVNMQTDKQTPTKPPTHHVHPKCYDVEKNQEKSPDEEQNSGSWLFRGLRNDIKKRWPYLLSDYTDGFNWEILTVVMYMFCVTVVPTLTFGAILSLGTKAILAVKECLISQAVTGIIWSFFSCQPLLVMSPTGPFLVFEKALYQITESQGLNFLEVRLYTGIFLFLITIVTTSCNVARLIKYVTIFTEDIFCALISMIFFAEVYDFLNVQIHANHIENLSYYVGFNKTINCTETPISSECELSRPNSFLLQIMMVAASIAVFHYLRQISLSTFFGRSFRNLCNNFGGSVAVVLVTVTYHIFFGNVHVSLVNILPITGGNSTGGIFVLPTSLPSGKTLIMSGLAAPLLFVLLFVEAEIPQQMALRESRKLKKGGGTHWDLPIAGFCTLVSSVLGLPWMCPAAVQSLAHITALTKYKKSAPGEPFKIDYVCEQRVSGLITYIALGVFAVFGHFFTIPSAAIFGVFFYLGVRNLERNYLLTRITLCMVPAKHRGSYKFLELAPFYVIMLYTAIQICVLIGMFYAKSTQIGGLCFPLMLVACAIFVSKFLPLIFTKELLEALDGEDLDTEEEAGNDNEEHPVDFYHNTRIPV